MDGESLPPGESASVDLRRAEKAANISRLQDFCLKKCDFKVCKIKNANSEQSR